MDDNDTDDASSAIKIRDQMYALVVATTGTSFAVFICANAL